MSEAVMVARVDGAAQLVNPVPKELALTVQGNSYRIHELPEYLTIVIKEHNEEWKINEDPKGEWEIVFKPTDGSGCSFLGCQIWHPFMQYANRSPQWKLEDAVMIVTRGIRLMTHNYEVKQFADYSLRHVHTGEMIPRDILCE